MADLFDLDGKPTGSVTIPEPAPWLIAWAMRYFIKQPDGTYRETLPFVAHEPWPANWRASFIKRNMPNATE